MKISIAREFSTGLEHILPIVSEVSSLLSRFFENKNYGDDINEVGFKIICISKEFEWFSKVTKPKYIKSQSSYRDGIKISVEKMFVYDVKLNYDEFAILQFQSAKNILLNELVRSLENFDYLPKTVKDFNLKEFSDDFIYCTERIKTNDIL